MEGTLGSRIALLFAEDRGKQSCRKVARERDRRRRASRKQARRVGS
jgi:gas vesicle protein